MTLIYVGCAWMLGIYVGSRVDLSAWVCMVGALLSAFATWVLRTRPRYNLVASIILSFVLAVSRYDSVRNVMDPGPVASYNDGSSVTLRGWIETDPAQRDRVSNLQLSVSEVFDGSWRTIHGRVLVQVPSYLTYSYGDVLQLVGTLKTPSAESGFSYKAYLARQGIHSLMPYPRVTIMARGRGSQPLRLLYGMRHRTRTVIASLLPEPEAALLTGILVGSDEGIPLSLMELFRATGTSHIIVISGFNITLISAALAKVFSLFLRKYVALAVAIAAVVCYTVLVGAEPPVVRAAIMGSLATLATIVGRRSHALISLAVACIAMTAFQPFLLWEVSFQLSVASSLGLILYSDRLRKGLESGLARLVPLETAKHAAQASSSTVLSTLAAMITTLPIMVYHFRAFSPLSLVANLLILPVQPWVMYLGGTAAISGLIWLPLGRLPGWAAWLPLTYTVHVVEGLARGIKPSADIGAVQPQVLLAYYGLLMLVTLRPLRLSLHSVRAWLSRKAACPALTGLLAVATILVWSANLMLPDGKLHVAFLDVGQGDAALVRTPAGHRVLVDGGPSPAALLSALGRRLPFWDRRIDIVLVSHAHDDHLRGLLSVLERYQVRQVLMSDIKSTSPLYAEWERALAQRGVPVLHVEQPLQVDLGDGPKMMVLPPPKIAALEDPLEASLVARLSWDRVSFLFTGDLEADGLLPLTQTDQALSCTVLKVPHHGSKAAVSKGLLLIVDPELAVISVGADNRFGHPSAETVALLEDAGARVLRTDQVGSVEVDTDGQRYSVRTTRNR